MATDLERLTVTLEASLKQYEKELARANKITTTQLRKIEKDAQASAGRIERAFGLAGAGIKGALGGFIGGFSFQVLSQAVGQLVSSAAAIGDLSDKLGIGTDDLQALQYGAVQANMSFQDMEAGLLKFSKAVGEARNGSGALRDILIANGFDDAQIKALNYSDALGAVADLVRNAASEQDKMLIITQAFGRGGDEFIEFLANGKSGLQGFKAEVAGAGGVIEENLIRKAQELDDRWAALMQSMRTATQSAVLDIADALSQLFSGTLKLPLPPGARAAANSDLNRFGFSAPALGAGSTPIGGAAPGKGSLPNNINLGTGGTIRTPTVIPQGGGSSSGAGSSSRAKGISDAQRQAEAIERVVQALQFENQQLQSSDLQQRINTELRAAGVSATSAQGQEIARLVEANYSLEKSQEMVTQSLETQYERVQELQQAQMALAEMGVNAFERIAFGGEKATDVLIDLAKQIAEAAFQAAILGQGPLAGLLGGGSSGGLIGSLLGGFSGGFAGFYAKGGQIPSGKYGVVGEAGPELVRGPANVTPVSKMAGSSPQRVNINISLAGASGNAEVTRIARTAIREGLREYDRQRPVADAERSLRVQ